MYQFSQKVGLDRPTLYGTRRWEEAITGTCPFLCNLYQGRNASYAALSRSCHQCSILTVSIAKELWFAMVMTLP